MSSASSQKSNKTCDSLDTNIAQKLRRLKIEENVIWKNIRKISEDFQEGAPIYEYYCPQSKNFYKKLKDTFTEVKNLFEDIKSHANFKCDLEVVDIDEVKKDVLDLESKIRSYKAYLEIELSSHKLQEKELNKKLSDDFLEVEKIRLKPKVQVNPYNDVVPSPVKTLMNSPFKCQEIQDFQEFMANSKNRYGGWIAYNHNIFEQIWRKYFNSEDVECISERWGLSTKNYELFIEELMHKIRGIGKEEIISHYQWYCKYAYLKERQKQALEKWKTNKRLIKKVNTEATRKDKSVKPTSCVKLCKTLSEIKDEEVVKTVVSDFSDEFKEMEQMISEQINSNVSRTFDDPLFDEDFLFQDAGNSINSESDVPKIKNKNKCKSKLNADSVKNKSGFGKPTEQWISRCNIDNIDNGFYSFVDVEKICKLKTPVWRATMKQN